MCDFFTALGYFFAFRLLQSYFVTVFKVVFEYVKNNYFLRSTNWTEKYGSWAVVTGSTDGIGKAYAKELAKRGLNIVLVSRTQEKLDRVAAEISNYVVILIRRKGDTFNVNTKTVQFDFRNTSVDDYERVERELRQLEIGILVNNVGICANALTPFQGMSTTDIWDTVKVNIGSTLFMTKMILPRMQQRNKGAIVNLSSIVGTVPWPSFAVYSATKAFITNFTYALQYENQNREITIQLLSPSFVMTELAYFGAIIHKATTLLNPSAETFARHAVYTLGNSKHSMGYWPYILQILPMQMFSMHYRTMMAGILAAILRKMNKERSQEKKARIE